MHLRRRTSSAAAAAATAATITVSDVVLESGYGLKSDSNPYFFRTRTQCCVIFESNCTVLSYWVCFLSTVNVLLMHRPRQVLANFERLAVLLFLATCPNCDTEFYERSVSSSSLDSDLDSHRRESDSKPLNSDYVDSTTVGLHHWHEQRRP